MTLARGDVVILNFPQSPGQSPKRRPAVVIQSDQNNSRLTNSIFAIASSNVRVVHERAEVLIDIQSPAGAQTGLTRQSCVKCENLYTLPQSCVLRKIGELPDALMHQVDDALKASLGLS